MEILINKETDNLMKDTDAFLMLLKIAYNTKRDDFFSIPDLEIGQAFITADIIGISQQTFRTTKKKLAGDLLNLPLQQKALLPKLSQTNFSNYKYFSLSSGEG